MELKCGPWKVLGNERESCFQNDKDEILSLFSRSRNNLSIAGHKKHQKDLGIVERRLWSNENGIMT